ncbi:fasciclin domain-containing protein [Deinococcus petrolearius]|uniref:Fasciclin domain-containing protein n=1 Tax=Deinococcus petrolearius TaxID=1751295 RepID=A0ABW1DKF0_9DEIO
MKKHTGLMTLSLMLATPALAGGAGAPTAAPAASCRSIAQLVMADPQLSTLATAVQAAGLGATLSGAGSYTVFAPTNAAFAKVPSDQLAGLLNDPATLRSVLLYHVVGEKATAAQIRTVRAGTTVQGADIAIRLNGTRLMVNNATVTKADIQACNGIVHVIDTVLMPPVEAAAPAPAPAPAAAPATAPAPAPAPAAPVVIPALPQGVTTAPTPAATAPAVPATEVPAAEAPADTAMTDTAAADTTDTTAEAAPAANTVYDVLAGDDRFSTLRDLLSDAGLTETLTDGEYTIFAPTNDAFDALPEGVLTAIASDPEALKQVLQYHVVQGRVTADAAQAGSLNTAQGTALSLGSASVGSALASANGSVVPIDAVLLPDGFTVPNPPAIPESAAPAAAPVTAAPVTAAPAVTTTAPATTSPAADPAAAASTVTNPATATAGTSAGGAISGGTLAQTPAATSVTVLLGSDARFSTLRDLLVKAGLTDMLASGEYTIFAPTNDAFAKLPQATLDALNADPAKLRALLQYHVVAGRPSTDALISQQLTSAEGTALTVTRSAAGLSIGGASSTLDGGTAIVAGNSNVFPIDTVLIPPSLR